MDKPTLHIVFHTHWDREWYEAFETYRHRLMKVMVRIIEALEQDEIACFVLDGQTLPLDDYLEVAGSAWQKRVAALIASGRLVIGPWYIAMDEFLVQGESIIRNLELGHKACQRHGGSQVFGYLPDTFGHVSQMPQILKGFGIDKAMMWRGVDLDKHAFAWEGADGSRLLTIFLSAGYYQHILNEPDYLEKVSTYLEGIKAKAVTDDMLLTAGGDHLMPVADDIGERLQALRTFLGHPVKVNDFTGYAKIIAAKTVGQDLAVLKGELRQNTNSYILPNVWSTRSYLKVLNQTLEDVMTRVAEPLVALAYLGRQDAPLTYVDSIWEDILQNQPHDSICGCSIDAVHQENEMRAQKARQKIDALLTGTSADAGWKAMTVYQPSGRPIHDDDRRFMLFQPLPRPHEGVVEATLFLNDAYSWQDGFALEDERGNLCETVLIRSRKARAFASPLDAPPGFRHGHELDVAFKSAHLKATGLTRFAVVKGRHQDMIKAKASVIENAHVRITLEQDGTLTLEDKANHQTYRGLNRLQSTMDAGDTYNYAKPADDLLSIAGLQGSPDVRQSGLISIMTYRLVLEQPAGLDETMTRPLAKKVSTKVDVTVTLTADARQARVRAIVDQKARDHRLVVVFPTHRLLETTFSDSAYDLVERQAGRQESFVAEKGKEVPVVVDPSLSFIHAADQSGGLVIMHRGLQEYQTKTEEKQTSVHLTMVRSVGYLSRDDIPSRGGGAGPSMPTPEAQCLRQMAFDYGFGVTGDVISSLRVAEYFRYPPVFVSGDAGSARPSLIALDDEAVTLTSLRHLKADVIEVRLYNPTQGKRTCRLASDLDITSVAETDMRGGFVRPATTTIVLPPKAVMTLTITHKNSG